MYVLGCDVSKYQDDDNTPKRPDFKKLVEKGIKFVFIRASQNTSIDPDFVYNWKAAKDAGLIRGAYHFHEYRINIAKPTLEQAMFFFETIQDDVGEIPPAVDYERPNEKWPELPPRATGLANLEIWFNFMDKMAPQGILYTNPNTLLYNLRPNQNSGTFLFKHKLWIAQYLYKLRPDGTPVSPLQHCQNEVDIGGRRPNKGGWDKWTFWQFTDRLPGLDFGMESKQLDGDFYNGNWEEFCNEFRIGLPELSDSEKLSRLWKAHPELH